MTHFNDHSKFLLVTKTLYCSPKVSYPWMTASISVYSNYDRVYFECSSDIQGAMKCREEIKDFLAQGGFLEGGRILSDGTKVAEFKLKKDL